VEEVKRGGEEPEPSWKERARTAPPAGMIRWADEAVKVVESAGMATLKVERVGEAKGEVSVAYTTKDQQARAGKDYEEAKGTLTFADGDKGPKEITVIIMDDDDLEKDETFTVVLSDASNGAVFDVDTDGGETEAICTVTILNDDARATRFATALQILRIDFDNVALARSSWKDQVLEVFRCPPKGTSVLGHLLSLLTMPWRLMFSLVPPPGLGGGWPCFCIALFFIGFQVVLISDFAGQMGCQMNIRPGLTAITFVALGTSLPDLFASKKAAIDEKTADNSIGNVTGSNSVNVFFGLGVPWTISAVAWKIKGADAEWYERYGDMPRVISGEIKSGDFVVKSDGLGFSVIVFVVCALLTIGTILVRRPAELGGGTAGKYATAAFFTTLWVVYVLMSALAEYRIIQA